MRASPAEFMQASKHPHEDEDGVIRLPVAPYSRPRKLPADFFRWAMVHGSIRADWRTLEPLSVPERSVFPLWGIALLLAIAAGIAKVMA